MNEDATLAEFVESLRELDKAVHELHRQSLDTRDALSKVINDSHLRSMLTLQKEDFQFRRMLDLADNPRSSHGV